MSGSKKREKCEHFEDPLETAPLAVFEIDYKTPRFLRVNQGVCDLSGYTRKELLSMNPADLLDAESAERFRDRIKRGLAGQKIDESVEFKFRAKDGHAVWTILRVRPTYEDGKLNRALVVAYDITGHKEAEEALLKLNRHLRAISDSNQALVHATDEALLTQQICNIIVNDCGHTLVWIGFAENDENKTVRPVAFAGFDKGYIDALRVTWDENSERGRGPTGTVIRTGKPYICNMKADVNFVPWLSEARKRGYTASLVLPLTSFEGQTFGALNIYSRESNPFPDKEVKLLSELSNDFAHGITILRLRKEREQAEETLRKQEKALVQSEKRYRRLYESSLDGIVARDLQGNMIDCNQAYAKMVGYTKEEVTHAGWRQVLPKKWHKQRESIAKEIIENGGSIVFEREYRRKKGEVFPASVRMWRLTDDKGKTIGTWSIVRDITEQKKLQRKLEEHSENLEKIIEERTNQLRDAERMAAIGATAGMVGHDIRNPLQAIMSDVFLVKSDLSLVPESEEKEGIKESLDSIENNVDYINKIVQDLQDYAKPLKPTLQEARLDRLCEEVTFNREIPNNIEASCLAEENAKKMVVDPALLKRILDNLVNNAIQAMPNGGKLNVHAYREAGDVVITVQDDGLGIPEEVRTKLFTPLFTTKSKGQGFGLAVVKRLTDAMGGTVTFESEVGKGTKFIVSLPSASNN